MCFVDENQMNEEKYGKFGIYSIQNELKTFMNIRRFFMLDDV